MKNSKKISSTALKSFIVIAVVIMLLSLLPAQAEINEKSQSHNLEEKTVSDNKAAEGLDDKVAESSVAYARKNNEKDIHAITEMVSISNLADKIHLDDKISIATTTGEREKGVRTAGTGWTEWPGVNLGKTGCGVLEIASDDIDADGRMEIVYIDSGSASFYARVYIHE